jgi:hypothetical protein
MRRMPNKAIFQGTSPIASVNDKTTPIIAEFKK